QLSWRLLRRVAEYARPYWVKLVIVLITMVGISLISLIPPLLIRDFIDHTIPARDTTRLNFLALGMVAVPLINGLLGVAQRYMSSFVGEGIILDLRSALYAHLQRMGLRFYTNTQVGEMMSRLNNDVVGAQRAVTGTLVTLLSNTFSIVTTLIIMVSMEWRLTLLGVAILPLFVIPARRVGTVLRGIARRSMEINARMNAMMNETLNISGAILVKIFGRYRSEVDRFRGHAEQVRDIGVRQAVVGRWFYVSLGLASAIGSALVFLVGGHLVLQGAFTIGTIVAFSTYLGRLYGPLTAMTNARVDLATSMVSFERVFEVLDLPIEIRERPEALDLVDPLGNVSFAEVSFSYEKQDDEPAGLEEQFRFARRSHSTFVPPKVKSEPSDEKEKQEPRDTRWAVQDVSFEIPPGSMAALVGPSGAGKTTITYLLPRLFDPTSGRVGLDGFDLRDLTLDTIAKHIGMVTQETYLFHTTIRENLRYAKTDATQDELELACTAANIHDFISSLAEGYDTVVGERGYRLSGGEKQRVAIARVLLKDPKILILDEATSHLDSLSEALIKEAMQVVRKGRTSLVIAHRLSTVINADLILVMDKGRLVESGRHEDLLEQDGIYADLYQTQFFPEGAPR
ncbi:MAG: ABC transporter ATP-binding protein, partial [Anaerolineales bacterium]|nr:ABC transporter ATP-binding protein [Anaerolineales bacterium]